MGSLIDSATSDPGVLDEGTCVLLALLVSEGHIRDLAWALLSPTNAEEHVRLWAGVVAHVPPTLAAAPLCLLGMAAWVYGSGALLNCCCERVAQVDPSYSVIKTSTAEPSFGTNRCYLPYLRDAETLAERDRQCCGKSAHERFLHLFGNRWGSRCRLDGALKSHRWPDDASDHCLSRHSGALKPLGCVP